MLRGSLVAIVTPMRDDGAVDFAALDRLLDFHLEAGTHGIVAVTEITPWAPRRASATPVASSPP